MHAPHATVVVSTSYRPDIDGLRAVAVLSVLLFHLKVPGFGGGFVGVDVFFVISGYLIAKLIKDGVEAQTFTLLSFYVRRARRLLPALFATLASSFVFAFLLLTPEHFRRFGISAAAAAVSMSNFYFWRHSSYFDLATEFTPLLHTWSLSVEEQFYLVFPVCFLVALRWRWLAPVALAAVLAISLALSIRYLGRQDGQSMVFYVPVFRAFEFAIGALLLWTPPPDRRIQDIALAAGLALIAYSVFFYTIQTPFPGAHALAPCIGAALCIYAGRNAALGMTLRNRVAVFIGKISYSVYLIHWPLLIFYRYYAFRDPTPSESAVIFVLSLGLGHLSYRFIEQPFRKGGGPASFTTLAAYASIAVNIALAGYVIWSEDGWSWRIKEDARRIAELRYENTAAFVGSLACQDFCEFGDVKNPKIVLVTGDSHVDHYTKALAQLAPQMHFKLIQSGSCFMGVHLRSRVGQWKWETCRAAEIEMREWIRNPNVIAVIHSQRWSGYGKLLEKDGKNIDYPILKALYDAEIADILKLYDSFGGKVVFMNAAPNTNLTCLTRPLYIASKNCPIPSVLEFTTFAQMMREAISGRPNVTFIDPADTICHGQKCEISVGGQPIYSDEIHLSVHGARLIVPKILEKISGG